MWSSLIIAVCCCASISTPASADEKSLAEPKRLEIDDVIAISSHEQLAEMSLERMEAFGQTLGKATDAKTAREVCLTAERQFMELELIAQRVRMLRPPTEAEQKRLLAAEERCTAATNRLRTECDRIAALSDVNQQLRSVMFPLYGQFKALDAAKAQSLSSLLQTIRSQIELYKLQHSDNPPDFSKHGWAQLTSKTKPDGLITDSGAIGPYLHAAPVNPLTQSSKVLITRGAPKAGFQYQDGDCGFLFDESTGRLYALDDRGRIFDENRAMVQVRVD
jgi:hypothetical protein